jgi:deoxycytidylate deaminase
MTGGSELMIGLVGAAGTDLLAICDSLRKALGSVGYRTHTVRLSHELHHLAQYGHLPAIADEAERIHAYMNAGNELRQKTRPDVMALLGVAAVRVFRRDHVPGGGDDAEDQPVPRTAYIFNSLKREEEVALLQEVYGRSFLLISVFSSRHRRRDRLAKRIAESRGVLPASCHSDAEKIIERDQIEVDVNLGQNVRDTFPLGDIFLDADDAPPLDQAIERAISIAFGHPFETPTLAEMGMQLARSAALRSADLSRQVGYAACTADGQVLAVGANEVAKAGGGFYWPDSSPDQRDFEFADREQNAEMKLEILRDLLGRLPGDYVKDGCDLSPAAIEKLASEGKVKGSLFMSITEYGRAVHAEMAVITDAARRGVSLQGARMFGTTFPCHNCAKNIVAAGVREVIYIEPYPKSQVERLFRDSITTQRDDARKVQFSPFVGIAPHRYGDFFEMTDRKSGQGKVRKWDELRAFALPRIPSDPASYIPLENDKVKLGLGTALADASIEFIADSGEESG